MGCSSAKAVKYLGSSNAILKRDKHTELHWSSSFLGSWEPFADAVAPFLTNKDMFQLSACCREVLQLRYTLGRWSAVLDDASYERFRIMRHPVPPCFGHLETFDLVVQLGQRLSIRMLSTSRGNLDALAGVHTVSIDPPGVSFKVFTLQHVSALEPELSECLNLSYQRGIIDVSALEGVHTLNLSCCESITNVSALRGVIALDLSYCRGIRDVSALRGVHKLDLSSCRGIRDVNSLVGVHTLDISFCLGITDVRALGSVHRLQYIYIVIYPIHSNIG
jgi:hypothetical protein